MNWLRSSLRKWLGIGHEAELNNTVERLVARVEYLESWAQINSQAVNSHHDRIIKLENKPAVPVAKRKAVK